MWFKKKEETYFYSGVTKEGKPFSECFTTNAGSKIACEMARNNRSDRHIKFFTKL